MRMTRKNFISRASALGAMAALALTACGSPSTQTTQNVQTSPSTSTSASATPTPITEGKGAASRVANPAVKKLIAVSLSNPAAPKELMSVELPKVPNEILGVSSSKPAPVEAEAHGAETRSSESSSASADAHKSHEGRSH